MDGLMVSARLLLTGMFFLASIGKIADKPGFEAVLAEFATPKWLRRSVAVSLPCAEMAVAVLLVPASTAWLGGFAALLMLAVFTVGVGVTLARGKRPACNCFGQFHSSPIGLATIVRNVLFGACAAYVAIQGANRAEPDILEYISGVVAGNVGAVLAGAALTIAIAGEAWMIFHLLRQQGRLLLRIDALELHLEAAGVTHPAVEHLKTRGLPIGTTAPGFSLSRPGGGVMTLEELREFHLPIILIFSDPACRPCNDLMPYVERCETQYASSLTLAIVTRGADDDHDVELRQYNLKYVVIQKERELAERYEVEATPSAVTINGDGLIASPLAVGAQEIAALIKRTATESGIIDVSEPRGYSQPFPPNNLGRYSVAAKRNQNTMAGA